MAAAGFWHYTYLTYLSQPKAERSLYRLLKERKPTRFVELGIGSLERVGRLVSVAQRFSPDAAIHYAGLDPFEERGSNLSPMPLIHAHRQLQATGAKVRLVPGEPARSLPQVANALPRTDLLLIGRHVDFESLERAWFFVPRMCHAGTTVLRERVDASGKLENFETLTLAEVERLAADHVPAARAA